MVVVACALILCGCRQVGPKVTRVTARPVTPSSRIEPGEHRLGLGTTFYRGVRRDGTLYAPKNAAARRPVPLLVLLHGGGGQADDFRFTFPLGEEFGVAILTLDARHNTWDGIDSVVGPDVLFIDEALRYTFDHVAIDPEKVALGGLSDGGMYALSVGVANGDLFTHLVAVAPGYIAPPSPPVGRPRIFLAHGTRDNVYGVGGTRNRLAPLLKNDGYDVTYFEFDGPHFITPTAAREALAWLVR